MLKANQLNIEYVYGFGERTDNKAVFIFRITDIDKALKVIQSVAVDSISKDRVLGSKKISSWELIESL